MFLWYLLNCDLRVRYFIDDEKFILTYVIHHANFHIKRYVRSYSLRAYKNKGQKRVYCKSWLSIFVNFLPNWTVPPSFLQIIEKI
jgi:hypothetical protein